MATITAAAVKSLRDRTGAGMMDCKRALEEADGDEERAIDLLRQKGAARAAKRAGRETTEGVVEVASRDGATGMVAIACETDFVARNEEFRDFAGRLAAAVADSDLPAGELVPGEKLLDREELDGFGTELTTLTAKIGENLQVSEAVRVERPAGGVVGSYVHFGNKIGVVVALSGGDEELAREIAMHVAATDPLGVGPEDIPQAERDREKAVLVEQARSEGKPDAIVERIVEGRMRKFFEQHALLMQGFVKDPGTTVGELIEARAPGATVERFVRFEVGG